MKSNLVVFSGIELSPNTRRKLLALLLAFELIIAFSSLGYFHNDTFLPISITFINIFIIHAAMLFGPGAGALSGLIYGLCRMWHTDTAPLSELGRLFAPSYSGDPTASLILATVPHILAGLIMGLIFHIIFRQLPKKAHPLTVGILTCLGLYFHQFLMFFTMWWVFPHAGLTISRAVYPGFSAHVLTNWAIGVLTAVLLYHLFTDQKVLAALQEHEKFSSGLNPRFRRTIIYTSISFIIFAGALFLYINERHEVILNLSGIDYAPGMLSSFRSLSLQTMTVLAAVMFIIETFMIWQHEKYVIAQQEHEDLVHDIGQKHQQNQLELVSIMSSIYCETYYVDIPLSKNEPCTFITLKQDQKLRDLVPPTGYCRDFVQEGIINHVIAPESQSDVLAFLDTSTMEERLARNGGSMLIEFVHKLHGWCRASLITAEKDENNRIRRVLLTIRIIDEHKRQQLEMQEALTAALDNATSANAAKSDFLVRMSHDLRTPMNDILGITTIAGTHLDDKDRVKDCLGKINRSGKQLLLLINEILDISRIESGNLDLAHEEFSLPELLDNLITLITPMTENKHQTLEFRVNNFHHEQLIGDSRRIQQVFMSLADNAIRYTPEGGTIRITAEEKNSNRLDIASYEFTFEDNGYGIREEDLHSLFEPFFRPKDSRVARFQGSGLGLPIAKSIVRMMFGDIHAESTYGSGSRFTVSFSLAIQKNDDSSIPKEFAGLRVLTVSDQPLSPDTVSDSLRQLGMQAEWIISGTAAIRRAVEAHEAGADLDAIIFDWDSTVINNIELISTLRRRLINDTPVLIAAARDTSLAEQEAKEAGIGFLISKPLLKSRLRQLFKDVTAKEETAAKLLGVPEITSADFSGTRGLLVEDNELNAEIAAEILGMTGMTVEFAQDGKEAVDKVSASADGYYDVVFMDIQMPFMNGYEASKAIRELGREYTSNLPIFAMSANTFTEDVTAAKDSGMNEHISKPVDYDRLTKLLNRWLKK